MTDALIRCINDYLVRHPETTSQQVLTALTNATDAVEATYDEED